MARVFVDAIQLVLYSAVNRKYVLLYFSMARPKTSGVPHDRISTSYKVSERLRQAMNVAAAQENRKIWELVEQAFRDYLKKHHAAK